MPATSSMITLTSAWTKLADDGVGFMFTVRRGSIRWRYASSAPDPASVIGSDFRQDEHFGVAAPTEDCYARAIDGDTAVICLHLE